MNYTELEQSLKDHMTSSSAPFVSHINEFIAGTEAAVFSALKGPVFWKASESQVMVIGEDEYSIANGAIDMLDFYLVGPDSSTDGRTVDQVDHSFLREAYPPHVGVTTDDYGMPKYYSMISAEGATGEPTITLKVAPVPDATYTYDISYYGKSTTDSIASGNTPGGGATTTTWISVAFPDVLLYGALERAAIYLKKDPSQIQGYGSIFKDSLTLLKNMTEGRQPTDDSTPSAAAQTKGL